MVNENDKTVGMIDQVEKVEAVEAVEPVEPEEIIEPPADAHCPNCNGPGIRKGKTIACQVCDASFRFTKEGPKVQELGPFDKLALRVGNIETALGKQPPEPETAQPAEPETAQPAEPETAEPAKPEIADDGI